MTGRRRVLEAELNGCASIVRGPGAAELVIGVTGKRPVWISRARGYSVQESTARDVIAAAEVRLYDVVVTGPRKATVPVVTIAATTTTVDEQPDPGEALW